MQREVDIVQEAVREKESLRAEAARRENLLAEEKQNLRVEAAKEKEALRNDARHREKLFLESNDRDKDRAMKEMARREELLRKTAQDEAEKRIALILSLIHI